MTIKIIHPCSCKPLAERQSSRDTAIAEAVRAACADVIWLGDIVEHREDIRNIPLAAIIAKAAP